MKRHIVIALAAVCAAMPAAAQQALRSGYFLDGYMYRHQLNPALSAERGYVSMPALGNLNIGTQSNFGVSDFLFKQDNGQLTTFMNKSVDGESFLGGLAKRNMLNMNMNMGILSVGFLSGHRAYNTVEINLRTEVNANIPKDMFGMLKNLSTGSSYNISGLGLSAQAYAEVSYGHSHQIDENWTVGGKFKLLLGLAQAQVKLNNLNLTLGEEKWTLETEGTLTAAAMGDALQMPTKEGSDEIDWDNFDLSTDNMGLGGMGMAIDLGVVYKTPVEGLEVSAAVTDLGFIKWKSAISASTPATKWEFTGFENVDLLGDSDEGDYTLSEAIDDMTDDLEDAINLRKSDTDKLRRALGATVTIGASYTLPQYDKLKFGFLSTTRVNGQYTWSEGRFSANYAPAKMFDMGVNYAISTFGSSFGWVLNLHQKGFSLFLGSDHEVFKVTKQFVPVHHLNTNVSLGINFPFGRRKEF